MKAIVVYTSQTGFTEKYAKWIGNRLGAEVCNLDKVKKKDMNDYDAIIYGGWACAGNISKVAWFKKNIENWKDKKLAVSCVGGSPDDNPEIMPQLQKGFTEEELKYVKIFYFQGGFNYERMPKTSKVMMKLFLKALKSKKDKTEKDEVMIKMIAQSYDISDEKFVEPLVSYIEG